MRRKTERELFNDHFKLLMSDLFESFKKQNKYRSLPKNNNDWSEWAYYCGGYNILQELKNNGIASSMFEK